MSTPLLEAPEDERHGGEPLPPMWRLAGEPDDDGNEPHIVRGID